ncbi:MBOAT family protein [Leptospira wolffii]|uniref:MBOAT family O-acyltransferase n=1 Tax=Leptospira wolffii TaxID=409998 RepID=UPI001083AB47|nr:MBOAT family O-acyltransferase [Leptospira wolffii]TGK59264.1 MBOAT family protein [Leptospira wolffii]TGK71097.1 MBOAT family protein [Leptospira wolffii]TGK71354.1 MBOAT family protein [Leptospira wolffii]TGL29369.1 MBOAT family protein [Leptospira wolffii]
MNFTTPLYFFFFLLIFLLRWILPFFRFFPAWIPKPFLLIGSYCFYLSWNPKFGFLLFATSLLDFCIGKNMGPAGAKHNRLLLALSVGANLSVLAFFKYFNFFIESGNALFSAFGLFLPFPVWHIVLPVGISFYTFQSLSYTIDVYRGEIPPEKNFWNYALFLSFFPQLVAGPIVPARAFLPQLAEWKNWASLDIREGLVLILIGVWKKAVLADTIAEISDLVFRAPDSVSSFHAWMGVFAYSLQIYFDFSGYTDIALGSALLLGFRLVENFRMPYLASSFSDFWRRWHISLSSWLRNYLYIPMGGSRKGDLRTYSNLMITMLLGGLWHGASWNFVVWGGIHGALLATERFFDFSFLKPRKEEKRERLGAFLSIVYRGFVILSVVLVWIFFRSPNWEITIRVFSKLFLWSQGLEPNPFWTRIFVSVFFLFSVSTWIGSREESKGRFKNWYLGLNPVLFGILVSSGLLIAVLFSADSQPFLYFVF